VRVVNWVEAAFDRAIAVSRERSAAFDHFWLAKERYGDKLGGRLAAAIAYYGFFAAFALALVAYSVLGFLLDYNVDLVNTVDSFLKQNLPWLDSTSIKNSRGTVGVVGLVGLVLTGVGWVEALRSSQRLIWLFKEQPGNPIVRRLIDLGLLFGLFLLLGLSLVAADGIQSALEWIEGERHSLGLTIMGWALAVLVNMLLAAALLTAVPRLRMPVRRLFPSVLLVGLGITLLTRVGRFFIARSENNPAYQVVAGAVGLLVYLYIFNQLVLFGAALAATGRYGKVVDMAAESPSEDHH
jgi:membrane protein